MIESRLEKIQTDNIEAFMKIAEVSLNRKKIVLISADKFYTSFNLRKYVGQ